MKLVKKKEDSFVSAAPILKFIGMLGILLTFLVFNIMLAGAEGRDPQANWRIGSLCFHVVLPIMYIADWFLFYERKKAKWYYPIASIAFPAYPGNHLEVWLFYFDSYHNHTPYLPLLLCKSWYAGCWWRAYVDRYPFCCLCCCRFLVLRSR